MDEKYVIYSEELTHHGIPGMKWGIRRYQNKDGSLTNAGKKRYEKELAKAKAEQKVIKNRERTKAKLDKLEEMKRDNAARKKALDDANKSKSKKDEATKKATSTKQIKSVKDLSDEELSAIVRRAQLEQQYNNLHPKKVSLGKKVMNDVLAPALMGSAKNVMNDFMNKKGKELLGLNDKKDEDPLKGLKDEVTRMQLEKQHKELSSHNDYDKKLQAEVTRMSLEKRREELLEERKKKKEEK